MANQSGKKFTWVIKNIQFDKSNACYSDTFEIGTTGCTCRLLADPYTGKPELLHVQLLISCDPPAPTQRRRYVKFRLTVVNQLSEEQSVTEEGMHWFDSLTVQWVSASQFFLQRLQEKDGGFLINDETKISAEVEVFEVIDKLDTLEELEKTTRPPSKIEEVSCVLLKETSKIKESIDVKGFHVLPSQVESVRRIFERHPGIAVEFRAKNQLLSKAFINSLLSLIETLCQPLQDLSNGDLVQADITLTYVKDSGFRVDWLEEKLDQVKEKKKKEMSGVAILKETEESLRKLNQKCAELEALAEVWKAELSATRTPLSFEDFV